MARIRWSRVLLAVMAAVVFAGAAEAKKHHGDDDEDKPKKKKKKSTTALVNVQLPDGVTRLPYLQSLATDSVLVVWTATAPGEPHVDFGPTDTYGSTVRATSEGARHVAVLRGLRPGTLYQYRVRAGERVLAAGPQYQFRTGEGPVDTRYSFFVTGDVGDPEGDHVKTAESILRADPLPEFGLICGDVVYDDGRSEDYDANLMTPWRNLLCRIPLWPALGNHDWHVDPENNFRREWYLPNNEHYYSFNWGNAHFIALDTRDDDIYDLPNQVAWLERDLAANRGAAWTFVYFHHPGITCTYKGNSKPVVEHFLPVFDRYEVDVVFNGHAHTYERLYPIRAGQPVDKQQEPNYVDPRGTIYIVSGAGSSPKEGKPTRRCGPTVVARDETLLWTLVEVDGAKCTIRSRTSDGDQPVDVMTLTKTRLTQRSAR